MRARTSAFLIAGNSITGRTVAFMATRSTESPSSGIGGPPRTSVFIGALTPTSTFWMVPADESTCVSSHSRTSGATVIGQMRLKADIDIGVPAKPSASRGSAPL